MIIIPNDRWFLSLPPCSARVPCGNGEHAVRWAAGSLELPAHPDPEAERVLAALGGEQAACVRVFETWRRHTEDLRVLQVGPRSPADQITIGWDQVPKPGDEPRPRVSSRPAGPLMQRPRGGPSPQLGTELDRLRRELQQTTTDLVTLLALGPAFGFRLSGHVAAAHAARASAANRPALTAAVQGRLAPLADDWLGIDPDHVVVLPYQPGETAAVELTRSGADLRLRARLAPGWLASVWACGLGLVDEHLVIETVRPGWPDAQVLALPWPGKDPALLDVHGTATDDSATPTWTVRR